jgi:hypothetical protein
MHLYLLTYEVKFKQDVQILKISDTMVVPAKSETSAKKSFLATIEKAGTILMRYNDTTRIMAPIRDLNGEVSITSCVKL